MPRSFSAAAIAALALFLAGCSGTIPVQYETQSFVKVEGGEASMSDFTYAPASAGDVKSNQLQNTAVGSVYIGEDVAQYVQRATALELQSAGVTIEESAPVTITGDIQEFELDDLGYSVDWSYSITYTVAKQDSGEQIFQKTYTPEKRTTGKFGNPSDYTSSINLIILDAVEAFLEDAKHEGLFQTAA